MFWGKIKAILESRERSSADLSDTMGDTLLEIVHVLDETAVDAVWSEQFALDYVVHQWNFNQGTHTHGVGCVELSLLKFVLIENVGTVTLELVTAIEEIMPHGTDKLLVGPGGFVAWYDPRGVTNSVGIFFIQASSVGGTGAVLKSVMAGVAA